LPAARLGLRWCPQVRYEEPPHIAHDEADQVLRAALRGETTQPDVNSVLVGLALDDDDRAFVERWCVRIARRAPDLWLRGLASLCIGRRAAIRRGERRGGGART
jgi:hypothetical protein